MIAQIATKQKMLNYSLVHDDVEYCMPDFIALYLRISSCNIILVDLSNRYTIV